MDDLAARDLVVDLASAHIVARAVHVVADLGIADHLGDTSRSGDELAAAVGVDADALERVLRLLEGHGLFARDPAGRWSHTTASRSLRSDHPTSLLGYARMSGTPINWESLTHLEHSVRTGEPSACILHPNGWLAYLESHPDEHAIFQQAMTAKAHADVAAVLANYDFSRHRWVADIGGGHGHLVRAVLDEHPHLHGVLFDLPHVVAGMTPRDRLEIRVGDFFCDPLPGCDAYLLMNVLHDWPDPEAITILSRIAEAAATAASVLIIEAVVPNNPTYHRSKTLDVLMLTVTGGRERTLTDYESLLTAAGLEFVQMVPTPTSFSIIEGRVR